MNVALRLPTMTREAFLDWDGHASGRFEFDGRYPVAMTGGGNAHNLICQNIYAALRTRLRGTSCVPMGPDAGLATSGNAVRYPDALVTCTPVDPVAKLVAGVVVVVEVISPSSGRIDRIDKVEEYLTVPTILRYLIVESATQALTNFWRAPGARHWTAITMRPSQTVLLPEIAAEIPVSELYEGLALPSDGPG